jgi:hypothetical protein
MGGIAMRMKKLKEVMAKDRWTSKSPLASSVPLTVTYFS